MGGTLYNTHIKYIESKSRNIGGSIQSQMDGSYLEGSS